ncbi:hypothetical protein TruAng_000917 [Truncatella angustata]|nr:hypothetical protein TruAng_000917 [Truncatella angustata]
MHIQEVTRPMDSIDMPLPVCNGSPVRNTGRRIYVACNGCKRRGLPATQFNVLMLEDVACASIAQVYYFTEDQISLYKGKYRWMGVHTRLNTSIDAAVVLCSWMAWVGILKGIKKEFERAWSEGEPIWMSPGVTQNVSVGMRQAIMKNDRRTFHAAYFEHSEKAQRGAVLAMGNIINNPWQPANRPT